MKRCVPVWLAAVLAMVSVCAGLVLDRAALSLVRQSCMPYQEMDLYELESTLKLGMTHTEVVRRMGRPRVVADSLDDLEGDPYPMGPPKGERILLYTDYPWGIVVYIDKKHQRVTRLMMVRHL